MDQVRLVRILEGFIITEFIFSTHILTKFFNYVSYIIFLSLQDVYGDS